MPLVSLTLTHQQKSIELDNILLDTGCSKTIFDTDILEQIGIDLDLVNGQTRVMYGVGGRGELCYEQNVENLSVDSFLLSSFQLQLGLISELYGFDGILGVDFMIEAGLKIDFNRMKIDYHPE
ncbi:aspartyl protease family protein [Ammoniphilus sp. 3BR4]|uniref:aspartyl protease family protein n=1 Tax=Ammoniphilus sp. 3BR4 TaxID=3158265 RepID=UPI003467D4E2